MTRNLPTLFLVPVLAFASCTASQYTTVGQPDQAKMVIDQKKDPIDFGKLQQQNIVTFQERTQTRTFIAPMIGALTNLGVDAVKKMIANDKKKYTAEYKMALTDMVFYDQLSTESAFDPVGMQFNGFTVVRTFETKEGSIDTALVATFELDKTNPYEILNNSVFRLKLKKVRKPASPFCVADLWNIHRRKRQARRRY